MIRIAILGSNMFRISPTTKKGTEILHHIFLTGLAKHVHEHNDLAVTVFASGDSEIPFPTVSINQTATSDDPRYNTNDQKLMELALISKALSMEDQFDLFHVHISNGEYVLPLARLTRKPILVTMHGAIPNEAGRAYYKLFQDLPHVHFVAVSENQKSQMPDVRYAGIIHHGIETTQFAFDPLGGDTIVWAGRAIPEKGLDTVLDVIGKTRKNAKLFMLLKPEYEQWFEEHVVPKANAYRGEISVEMNINVSRVELIAHYQHAKLFLFPISWEEPFGLVMVEAMACGTPVVAYARGSIPEVIVDGQTGFIVNASANELRGDFAIKSFGLDGLAEAIEKIYAMAPEEYQNLRKNCRDHVQKHFTRERMINQYIEIYKKLITEAT